MQERALRSQTEPVTRPGYICRVTFASSVFDCMLEMRKHEHTILLGDSIIAGRCRLFGMSVITHNNVDDRSPEDPVTSSVHILFQC